jgi:hypothetical protein
MEFIKTFFDARFLFAYIEFLFSKKVDSEMKKDAVFGGIPMDYDETSNEFNWTHTENIINSNPYDYYLQRKSIFRILHI